MCIIVFQDHPSHFKDTEQANSLGLSQLSNLSDFPFYNQYHFILYFILLSFPIKIIIPIICPVKSERIWSIESGCKNTEVNLLNLNAYPGVTVYHTLMAFSTINAKDLIKQHEKFHIYIYTLKLSSIFGIGKKSDYFWAMVYIETGFCIFLATTTQLHERSCPVCSSVRPPVCLLSVGVFVGLPVCQFVSPSVRPSVCQTFFTMFLSSFHHELSWVIAKWCIYKTWRSGFKGQGHKRLVWPVTGICGP